MGVDDTTRKNNKMVSKYRHMLERGTVAERSAT